MSLKEFSEGDVEFVLQNLKSFLESYGLEAHSFLIRWYNEKVQKSFKIDLNEGTLAFTIVSTPSMFEKAFIPFIVREDVDSYEIDPLDTCMKSILGQIKNIFPSMDIEVIHDFELSSNRRPKVLMQTAGHVSGAAKFYQRYDLGQNDPWESNKKIFGVSIHPSFGGWFAFRAVVLIKNVICSDMKFSEPKNVIMNSNDLIRLLDLFNSNWKDSKYRDVIPVLERYSKDQQRYFSTPPGERLDILKELREKYK